MIDTALFDIANCTSLVTGAASGIGLAISEAMVTSGVKLALVDIDALALEKAYRRFSKLSANVIAIQADVADRRALRNAFDQAVQHFGYLDIVFGNAGIGGGPGFSNPEGDRNPAGEISAIADEVWDRVINTNLNSVFTTIQCAALHMKRRGRGKIIITTSIASFKNESWVGTPYMPAKAGAAHLVRQAALELASDNITVNAIAPGVFQTNISGGRLNSPSISSVLARKIPLRRLGQTRDIAGLAVFLASSASDYITGAEIPIDGGSAVGTLN